MDVRTSTLVVTLLIGVTSQAEAASSTDLAVTGLIIPSACSPSLSGGGVIDHGKVAARDLNPDTYTSLQRQVMRLNVRCDGPTLFSLSTLDNREGTSAIQDRFHGLGMTANDEKLGSASLRLSTAVADTEAVRTIVSTDGGATWVEGTYLGHTAMTAVASATGSLTPIAVQELDADVRLNTMIARSDSLTLVDEVPLDGHVTVQLRYL